MEQTTLPIQIRTETGKGYAKKLRRKGFIPAVIYRGNQKPIHISVDPKVLEKTLRSGLHTLLKLEVEGGGEPTGEVAIIKEIQREPVFDKYIHAELVMIDLNKPMEIEVGLEFRGTAPGVTLGGILQPLMRQIEVRCLPADLPRHIEVDVSELKIGDVIHIKDIKMPEGVKCLEDPDAPVVMVAAPEVEEKPKAEVEEAVPAEGATAGEKKADGAPSQEASKTAAKTEATKAKAEATKAKPEAKK